GAGDPTGVELGDPAHRAHDARNRLQTEFEFGIATASECVHPLLVDAEPGVLFDDIGFVTEHFADEARDALLGGQLPAEFAQHLMQDTVRDALGVHEDAIAVEQNRGELRVRSHGPILPSATHAGSHRPDRDRTGPTGVAPVRSTDRTAVPTAGLTPARSSPPSTGRAPRRARRR